MANDVADNLDEVAEFLAWCRKKPAGEEYNYLDAENCAFAQFAREMGIPDPVRNSSLDGTTEGPLLPPKLERPLVDAPYTFGALAERVERQLVERAIL